MKILGFGTILNIILDPPLIAFYEIKGAAAATVISQFVVFIMFVYIMVFKNRSYLTLNFKNFKFNKNHLLKIFKIGIPSALSMLIMSIGLFIYNIIFSSTIRKRLRQKSTNYSVSPSRAIYQTASWYRN